MTRKPMSGLIEKIQMLVTANLHALVDSALQASSLAVVDQYVREVEKQIEERKQRLSQSTSDTIKGS